MKYYKKIIILSIFIAILGNFVFAKSKKSEKTEDSEKLAFSIYGSDHMVSIPLPNYWTVDMDVAHQNNLNGFFYIAEKGINESPAYIFVSLYEKNPNKSFSDFIQYKTTSFAEYQPKYYIKKIDSENFKTSMNNWNVEIYDVRIKSGHGHYQKIAYMECENKYYIEIYIDCYQDDYKNKDKYIQDFIECFHGIDYLNIQLQEQ
ncbi:MAG: hypothetical protein K6F15_02140 [Treponema sp.]|nr:hypothetical protein [Treponema sp.]